MMSCLHHPHVMQTMMMWCSFNVKTNDVMTPHSYMPQWNVNASDIMVMCFAPYANLVTS